MPQVINQPRTSFWDTFAQASGPQLGEALNTGLTAIAQHKIGQLMERQQQSQLSSALQGFGYTPDQASQLAQFGPQLLAPLIKEQSRARVTQDMNAPGLQAIVPGLSAQEAQAIGRLAPGLQQAWFRQIAPSLGNIPQEEGIHEQFARQEYEPTPYEMQQQSAQAPVDLLSLLQGTQQGMPDIGSILGQQAKPVTPATPFTAPTLTPESPVVQELSGEERKKELLARREAEKARKEQAKEEAAKRKQTLTERALEAKAKKEEKIAQSKEAKERFKATEKIRENIIKEGQAAHGVLEDIGRLEELNNSGKLDTPGYVEFLKRSGLDIPALMNPESEEFQKIVQNFTRDAKNYFGGRVSNYEVEQFLKTVPSLAQSPEGRKRIMANLKRLQQGKVETLDIYRKLLKENKGVPPYDLLEQVSEQMEKKYEKLGKQFKADIAKPVPAGQNRLITALQSVLGDVVGSIGSKVGPALKGAAKGAIAGAAYGRLGGPIGAAGGAGLGALGGLTGLF